MTPDEAFLATRDVLIGTLHSQAAAQGLTLSIGQITGMADTALEASGFRVLATIVQAADIAAGGYAGTYEEVPEGVEEADATWRDSRATLSDYPNIAGLIAF